MYHAIYTNTIKLTSLIVCLNLLISGTPRRILKNLFAFYSPTLVEDYGSDSINHEDFEFEIWHDLE